MNLNNNKIGNYRWVIASLLLFATTFNYIDRQVISYLKPFFCSPEGFSWTNTQYSILTSSFTLVYSLSTIFAGWFIDRIGTKLGLALSLILWSIFGIANAFMGAVLWLHVLIRSLFAFGEAGNIPASLKTVAEWFPKKERALATGLFNSGSNLGAMIAALFVPWCMAFFDKQFNWKMAFILTGAAGFIWLFFWFWLYNSPAKQKRLSQKEFEYIHSDDDILQTKEGSDEDKAKIPWLNLLKYKQTWAFFFGKLMTDGIWFFYLFWLPDYLIKQFGMTTSEVKWPTFIVYGVSIIGSLFGGSLTFFLINKGMKVYKARMTAMFIFALLPLIVLSTQYFGNVSRFGSHAMIFAVTIISIAAAAHQAWSANLLSTVSDMFPKKALSAVQSIRMACS